MKKATIDLTDCKYLMELHERIKDLAKASEIEMSREDWYKIYRVAGHQLP